MLRSGRYPLQQIINRIKEDTFVSNVADFSIKIQYPIYKKQDKITSKYHHILLRDGFNLNVSDKWFLSTDKKIVAMSYVADNKIYGLVLNDYESAFNVPIDSTLINVFKSKNSNLLGPEICYSLSEILCKFVATEIEGEIMFVPMHHTYPKNVQL